MLLPRKAGDCHGHRCVISASAVAASLVVHAPKFYPVLSSLLAFLAGLTENLRAC
jgi:hypothetical protein